MGHGREDRKGLITMGGRRKELPAYLPQAGDARQSINKQVPCALRAAGTSGSWCLLEHCRQLLKVTAGAVLCTGCVRWQLDVWVRRPWRGGIEGKKVGHWTTKHSFARRDLSMFWVRLYPVDGLIHISLSIRNCSIYFCPDTSLICIHHISISDTYPVYGIRPLPHISG